MSSYNFYSEKNKNNILQPTNRLNSSPFKTNNSKYNDQDLDELARELELSPSKKTNHTTASLKTMFGSPSVTVSSFKSTSLSNKYNNDEVDETPSWAKKNYRDVLNKSPIKKTIPQNNLLNTPISTNKNNNYITNSPNKNASIESSGYEYLCRIQAIKEWLEIIINENIPQSPMELITYMKNGIYLAKLSNCILPIKKQVYMNDNKLQFKHTENINRFFQLLDFLNVPDLFRFELTDLYDSKNVPKVWFCLHSICYILHRNDSNYPIIEDLTKKQLKFSEDDIIFANRSLINSPLPNFSSADSTDANDEPKYMNKIISPIKSKPIEKKPNPFLEEKRTVSKIDPKKEEPTRENKEVPSRPKTSYDINLDDKDVDIIKLQSLSRGANLRYSMFVKKIMLKSYEDDLTYFWSIIRGNFIRSKTTHKHRDELRGFTFEIIELQSIIRKKLVSVNKPHLSENQIIKFQSICRGKKIRESFLNIKQSIEINQSIVIGLQSVIRMNLVNKIVKVLISKQNIIMEPTIQLQSICRTKLSKKFSKTQFVNLEKLIELQSMIRRDLVIHNINYKHHIVRSNKRKITELQSIARGGISRSRLCNNVLINLIHEDDILNQLYSIVRGNKIRKNIYHIKSELNEFEKKSIIPVQSLFRGVLSRFNKEILKDDAYNYVNEFIILQSKIRGNKIRVEFNTIDQYYKQNVEYVIKAQAIIRRSLAQNDYQSLLLSNNASLKILRKFAHLLSQNDFDFQEEIKLSKDKEIIIEKSKNNENLETSIENIDLKLGLLEKNKITIEEFSNQKTSSFRRSTHQATDLRQLDRLNKSSRERIELYQSLFYILQTKPIYISNLFKSLDHSVKDTKSHQLLLEDLMSLFPISNSSINHHSREEYFLMKLIITIMENDIKQLNNISDITKQQFTFWNEFLSNFNNHSYQRQHLKLLFGKFVNKIIDDDELDFESDPLLIHSDIITKEIRIHGHSTNNRKLSPQEAIKLPEVSSQFVSNLMSLREHCSATITLIDQIKNRIPIHIKLICKTAYLLSHSYFPNKNEIQHLAVAGVCFWKHYFGAILQLPQNYGFTKKLSMKDQSNLRYLNRVMLQVFSRKPFNDNFLKPLNEYITSTTDQITNIITSLISIDGDIDNIYKLNEFDDIINTEKPKLTMKINSMISLENIISTNINMMSNGNDELNNIINELDKLINSPNDLIALTDLSSITLYLNPIDKTESLSNSKTDILFTQAKRCLLYIIRVQDEGEDLLELLISGITSKHEQTFQKIIEQERFEDNNNSKPYFQTSVGDLNTMTYHDLKKMCLEIILKLEIMGEVTRKNSFQDLLNQIVFDIKQKDKQRIKRKEQIEISNQVIKKLNDKEKFLTKQLSEYNNHVDKILKNSQLKPKDKKILKIIPVFSKQYFYHRELRKKNRFPEFGSYKLNIKKLKEMKILIKNSFSNESKLEFIFSCYEIGNFTIEITKNSIVLNGCSQILTIDDLLNLQYENNSKLTMFNGNIIFDSNFLIGFIFEKFYELKK
ncbi:IQG1 [Candida pseudojiufengensis]|uniref:IQG1 n=1 Tax=Candida pseudojiufengensis TaxID=497109 RepID=UPI0022250B4E|nr:IQG1 [Candida pseudojiufengensis]KAI5959836.1 IQG1 [Candida pseudojiufengensis]